MASIDDIKAMVESANRRRADFLAMAKSANDSFAIQQDVFDRLAAPTSALEELVARSVPTHLLDALDQVKRFADELNDRQRAMLESSNQWAAALSIVSTELPKRGWYLHGKEPSTLVTELAALINAGDWDALDAALLARAERLGVNVDLLVQWLAERRVPDHCTNRVRIFFERYRCGEHELATVFGLPLIDEVAQHLYAGKDFTTKRAKQPKPKIACKTASGPDVEKFASRFVQEFGVIHENVDAEKLNDPDYFNRSAILHGQMQRAFGPKDSAKTVMILLFLVFAYDDDGQRQAA